jgi:hypothetical protein
VALRGPLTLRRLAWSPDELRADLAAPQGARVRVVVPDGWVAQRANPAPLTLAAGDEVSLVWRR